MNWGNRILLLYLSFVALIITLVVVSIRQNIDLVATDYYAKELNFETDIQKMKNEAALAEKPKVSLIDGNINIVFPSIFSNKNIVGKLLVYKPSDAKSDYTQTIDLANGVINLPIKEFSAGMRKVKIDWTVDSISYLTEAVVVIP